MPLVSVIIPTYQRAHLVSQAIDSVLQQTFTDYEIIVINDGSTDHTTDILTSYQNDIIALHQKNQGTAAARNAGIRVAQGKYIAFLDDDDLWEPNKLEQQIPCLEAHANVGLVYANAVRFDETGILTGRNFVDEPPLNQFAWMLVRYRNFFPLLTVVVRRECLDQVGWFDETLPVCEDYDLWIRVVEHWDAQYVNQLLARYRVHQGHMSHDKARMVFYRLHIKEKALRSNSQLRKLSLQDQEGCVHTDYLNLLQFYRDRAQTEQAQALLTRYHQTYNSILIQPT